MKTLLAFIITLLVCSLPNTAAAKPPIVWGPSGAQLLQSSLCFAGGGCLNSASGIGSVTSVGLALPGIFSVTGSPVVTTGTLTGTLATQAANRVWAGPLTGSPAAPAFRLLVTGDLPTLTASLITDFQTTVSANTDVSANTAARHAAVTLGTANGLGLSGQQLSLQAATDSVPGALTAADHATFNGKQNALSFGNITGAGVSVTGGTGAAIGSGVSLALTGNNDLFIQRTGTDAAGCGTISNPCHTVGYALTLVTSPSSTNNWTIHVMSGRNDAEVDDLLVPPYTWISGMAPDVGSYLRLPSGKAIKLGSGWTSNGRGGIQNIYLGGGTSVNLDFAAIGGSAGSNFIFDNVTVGGSFNHTGRGVNGGDFLVMQNSTNVFGAATLTGDQVQSNNTNWIGSVTMATSGAISEDASFVGGSVGGAFSFTESSATEASFSSSNVSYTSTFTTVGTMTLTTDDSLPPGYTLSGGTTRVDSKNAASLSYAPSDNTKWASPYPKTVQQALDRIAAVVGAVTPIP